MPEPADELDALRAADPLDPASLPSPADPAAAALFERITMIDTSPIVAPTDPRKPARRPRLVWAAAAAAVVLFVGLGAVLLGGDDDTDAPDPDDVATEPITPGGPSSASCVELYDLQTLTNRATALDGTVTEITGDSITLTVNEWFRGGDSPEVTLNGAGGLSGLTSAGPATPVGPGGRLLVAGDGGFAWACGFTQPYDPAVADQWRDALVG